MYWEPQLQMMCPLCKTNVEVDKEEETFRYEDVCGSTVGSWKHICPNKDCILHKKKSFWNDHGDFYSGDLGFKKARKLFPDDKYAALNSMAKRHEVEIYGKGLKRKIYLSEWWTLKILKPMIEFKYKGDDMGNVLGRTWKLRWLYKSGNQDYYGTYYTSPIVHLYRMLKHTRRDIKRYKKRKSLYDLQEIWRWFDMGVKTGWDRKLYRWYFNTFHKKILNYSKNFVDFIEHVRRNKHNIDENFVRFWDGKLPYDFSVNDYLLKEKCKGSYMDNLIRQRKLERIIND
ncbi:MAG: hypothetical protein M0R46_11630 [Candidatus Muirbacterium halophilum]|nr:hypothetical protein [Candidatus Muirbacterium halophilum]